MGVMSLILELDFGNKPGAGSYAMGVLRTLYLGCCRYLAPFDHFKTLPHDVLCADISPNAFPFALYRSE